MQNDNEERRKKECREDMAHLSCQELGEELMSRGREGVILVSLPGEKALLFMTSGSPKDVMNMGQHITHSVVEQALSEYLKDKPNENTGP